MGGRGTLARALAAGGRESVFYAKSSKELLKVQAEGRAK